MARMVKKKKKNYRLRKSVRRTLGALFMISAIIVAAIPFPDAAATNGDPSIEGENGEVEGSENTSYNIELKYGGSDSSIVKEDIDGNKYGASGEKQKSYTLVQVGSNLKYEWQYEYVYDANAGGAIITDYNNAYSEKNIILAPQVNTATYVAVSADKFDGYFEDTEESMTVSYTDWNPGKTLDQQSELIKDFAHYFPILYGTYIDKCTAWYNYQNLSDEEKADVINPPSQDAATITGHVGDISDTDLRNDYYIEFVLDGGNKFDKNIFSFATALQPIEKPTQSDSEAGKINDIIYILKLNDGQTMPSIGYNVDNKNYIYSATVKAYELKGIGKGAFKKVKNAMTLELPVNLLYIADEAFEESFVTEIVIHNVEEIGNAAFKNSQLNKVTWSDTASTMVIGAEAFYNTNISEVNFPSSLNTIGEGAFASNKNLKYVNFSDSSKGIAIKDYAFYDCNALMDLPLENKQIYKIGEGAFATKSVENSSCKTFTFPSIIDDPANLGDLILAGRSGLKNVKMPINLGFENTAVLKDHIFQGCSGLECVEFPDNGNGSCGYIKFGPGMFSSVTNKSFYVKGPAMAEDGMTKAYPRTSTWACQMRDGSSIPYMYEIDGKPFYEISDGTYLKLIDSDGILCSCDFVAGAKDIVLNIEGTVGNKTVVGIADGCFSKEFLGYVTELVIEDDVAIKSIGNNVFAGASKMKEAYIGNLVESIGNDCFNGCTDLTKVTFGTGINSIGARAFKGCSKLTDVIFEQPANRQNLESFATSFPLSNIGDEAFAINENDSAGAKLTITGVIHPEYGPFAWAMNPENFVNKTMGIRVCYKTGAPTYQTVILDNINNYPTLVDYLQYSDLATIPATYIETVSPDVGDDNSNPDDNIATIDESDGEDTNDTENSETGNVVKNGFLDYKYENYPEQLNAVENYIIASVFDLEIPKGVKSIDVKGFINGTSQSTPDAQYKELKNFVNVVTYLEDDLPSSKFDSYSKYGLFNGDYEDGLTNKEGTIGDAIGNDVVETVTMHHVKYLPNNDTKIEKDTLAENGLAGGAFYECDNLQTVILGSEMNDVGSLPFLGCHKLNNVECSSVNNNGEQRYVCNNKILYENTDENTVRLVECLGSRGYGQDGKVNVDSDSNLLNVSELAVGCFSDCPELKTVSFEGNTLLTTIPDKTFLNDNLLRTVELPENIRNIGQKAFAEGGSGLGVWIFGREVSMATDSFDNTPGATVYTYLDTAAYNTAVRLLGPENVEPIPEGYRVRFFDYDGITELIDVQYVEEGENAIPPEEDPVREGYIFKGWNKPYKNITENTDIIALYDVDPNNPGGLGPGAGGNGDGTGNGSGSGSGNGSGSGDGSTDADGNKLYKLTVSNGEGSGSYPAGKTVTIKAGNAPKGATFAYWSCSNDNVIFEDSTDWITTLTMVASDVTVIANYTGQYTLEVEYGSGSGSYPAGAKVAISAVEAPQGRKFASWVTKTSGLNVENSRKESTVITMPASNAKITATYMDTGSISGNSTSKPSQNGTQVIITKPGISDKDTASAYVSGSSDNFIVKISESLEAADEVQKALQKKYPDMTRIKYFAMDISLYDAKGVNKITDTTGLKVNITMPIPDALREYAGNNRVGAVVNGELETLNPKFTTINGVPSVTFTATHFSPYTIYVDTGNLTVGNTLDSTPKTGDGIHPKWFVSIALACIAIILFTKRDRRYSVKAYR